MGSAAEGAVPAETTADVEKTEPSASRPETEKDSEKKHGADDTPEELDSEAVRAAKRARQDMTQAEVEEEGMTDHEVTMKCLRLVQSSLEYTARQANALKAVQEQLGEVGSLAYHSESCQRYALGAINQKNGDFNDKAGREFGVQNAERDKQFSDVLLAIQGQIADGYARGTVPGTVTAGTPITPNTGVASVGAASVGAASAFPPPAPVMPGCAASVTGGFVGPVVGSYGAPAPPPPTSPPPTPAPARIPITVQVRQPDGSVVPRQASPTRYLDDSLRSNAGYIWCDDHSYRRLI
eukprot:s6948_g1.t1